MTQQRIGPLRHLSLPEWRSVVVVATLCIPALSAPEAALANPLNDVEDTGAAFEHRGFSVTGGREEPLRHGSRSRHGVTLAQASSPESVAAKLTAEQLAAEREFWASVKASGDPADIRAYLEQFPDGLFAALARNWLKRLEETAQPQPPQATATPPAATQETAPAPASSPKSLEEALSLTRTQRVLVQRGLTSLGFDVGAADGILGARSRAGIRAWQSSRGEAATGYLDARALTTLLEVGGAVPREAQGNVARAAEALLSEALSEALPAVRRIEQAKSRASALSAIAVAQASAGDRRGATKTISEALFSARSIEDAPSRGLTLSHIARAQASAGDIQGALSTVRSITGSYSRASALSAIAVAQASAGDPRGATRTVSEALSTARNISDGRSRVLALGAIAKAQAETGDTRGVAKTVSEALSTARSIEDAFPRAEALSAIAEAQGSTGDTRGAAQTVSEALPTARSIEDAFPRAEALSAIAKAQASAGDTRGSAQTVSEALSIARTIQKPSLRAWALSAIAGAQARAGDIHVAVSTARGIKSALRRDMALRAIADAQANDGNIQGALSTAGSIEYASTYAWTLRDIAKTTQNAASVRSDSGATKTAAPGNDPTTPLTTHNSGNTTISESTSNRPVDSNGSTRGQALWGAYAPGQTTPSTSRVEYPYDVFGISWNFSSPESALEAAANKCRERTAFNCGDGYSVTFSSSADDTGHHLKSRCITAWVWANPGLSGLHVASWTSGVELPEYFQTIQIAEKKTACNER